MVCTMPSGVKWWLLRHGILASISGAFLLILFSLLTIIYALNFGFISFFVLILVISFGTPFLFSGFAYGNLYAAIRELPPSWVAEDFDLVRCRISLREGTKDYVVLYHGILVPYTYWIYLKHGMWLDWQQAPGHYQIWTPYRGGTHATRDRYSYLSYVRPSGVS